MAIIQLTNGSSWNVDESVAAIKAAVEDSDGFITVTITETAASVEVMKGDIAVLQ